MAKRWDAVADAINTRLEQLGMTQAELASKSRVSVATVREIQHGVAKRRSPRTLAALSEALKWRSEYLEQVADGQSFDARPERSAEGDRTTRTADNGEIATLRQNLESLTARVDEIERQLAGRRG
ncbi:Helix-turn-helix domain-containing protein [Amycolatopsis sacchari]|uniref:Helix-turn-helix domain-containing protein n=1 Tax=Amycolatopsis sacchari TaxID=115433 RepID=A0A1I3U287_9PSEU|nr:helix-turn-helix transcriptional regulator [Amycolatopsis sacchari]SFJ76863.1 Helix-turn-helix domain-containing protein [Amycolatopsis sacchari]